QGCGGQVIYIQADVVDEAAMRAAVEEASRRWGRIDGVLHIAGISGAAEVLKTTPVEFQRVLEAKIDGTLVLDGVLEGQTPDFVCHFSSSSAILGDLGSCDYALANRFQTAYARE